MDFLSNRNGVYLSLKALQWECVRLSATQF